MVGDAYGASNSGTTFQKLMDHIFRDLAFVAAYLDDIIIHSKTPEEHLEHLRIVFERLSEHKLLCRLTKVQLFQSSVKFLGFHVSGDGRRVDEATIQALQQIAAPTTTKELLRWLGSFNFYRDFISHFAEASAVLTDLLHFQEMKGKINAKLPWTAVHQQAFDLLRDALGTAPVLKIFDHNKPCFLGTDASKAALGGALYQEHNGIRHPIGFYSRKLLPAETRYTTREIECLAVKASLKHFRHYLLGSRFLVQTDHKAVQWLHTQSVDTLSDRLLCWLEYFSLYDFELAHIKGVDNVIPDGLSRPAIHVTFTDWGPCSSLCVSFNGSLRFTSHSSFVC